MSNGTTTVLRGSIGMSLCPDITPSSSAAMPEQSADVSSTPLHAHAVSWVSTSSTTCRMYSTEQLLCLPVQTPKHTEISSQTDGRKNSRATHPAFFILMIRNRGDAYSKCLKTGVQDPKSAQKCRFCAREARKRGFRRQKAHKNADFVLEMPENEGSRPQKRTKTPILCSKCPKMRVPDPKSAQKLRFCARNARK